MDDWRLVVYAVWAVGSVVAWGRVFLDTRREYLRLPQLERRRNQPMEARLDRVRAVAFREVVSDFALMLVALASFVALSTLIFGAEVAGLRGFALALALGAFLGAGIIRQPPIRMKVRR